MANELDGIVLMLAEVSFDDKVIGLISEQGVTWGGNDAEYTEVTAAQTRAVVKRVLKKAATDVMDFTLIELITENMVDVMGGTAAEGKWTAPITVVDKEGVLKITTVTGQVIEAGKASLSSKHRGTIGGDDPLGVQCSVMITRDGKTSPYSIDNSLTEG